MMNHEDIKKLLPAHSSGDLPPTERAWVEEHLSSCRSCRAELAELKTTLRMIRNTPEVEPPPWLTTRILAGIVVQPAPKISWLQRLFFPLQVKLPLEILALLIISVTGYYLIREPGSDLNKAIPQLKQTKPESAIPSAPAPMNKQTSTSATTADIAKTGAGIVQAEKSQADSTVRSSEEGTVAVTTEPPATRRLKRTSPPADDSTDAKTATRPSRTNGGEAVFSERARISASNKEKQRLESAAPAPAESFSPKLLAKEPAKVRISLIMGLDSLSAKTVRQAVNRTGGTVLPVSAALADRQLKARIPASKLSELLEQLEKMARIVERPAVSQSADTVEIDILW